MLFSLMLIFFILFKFVLYIFLCLFISCIFYAKFISVLILFPHVFIYLFTLQISDFHLYTFPVLVYYITHPTGVLILVYIL